MAQSWNDGLNRESLLFNNDTRVETRCDETSPADTKTDINEPSDKATDYGTENSGASSVDNSKSVTWGSSDSELDEETEDRKRSFFESSLFSSSDDSLATSPSSSSHSSYSYKSLEKTSRSRSAVEEATTTGLWVFGYGSLCWLQEFDFSDSMTGYVTGFSRRFYQGNVTHRGTPDKPGRVATLVEDPEGKVWGRAFKVRGEAALPYLNNRECELGGYLSTLKTFHPRDRSFSPFPAMLYVATPSSQHWLGDAALPAIADQIVESAGGSGHNVEYLLKLADFMHERVPEAADDHLFGLEQLVRERVQQRRLCLTTLMGEKPARSHGEAPPPRPVHPPPNPAIPTASTQFSNRVPTKKLRCVNI